MSKQKQPVSKAQEIWNGVKEVALGLDWGKFKAEVGADLKGMGAHGASELAAAIFAGSSYVMYQHGERDQPHDKEIEVPNTPHLDNENERSL